MTSFRPQGTAYVPETYSRVGKNGRIRSAIYVPPTRSAQMDLVPDLGNLIVLKIDPFYDYASLWASPLGNTLRFTFADLDQGIAEISDVNYASTEVLGRGEEFKTYVGTNNREIQMNFQFRAQGLSSGTMADILDREVQQPAKFLDGLKFPMIGDDRIAHAPPPCLFTVGSLLLLRVIITACQITWVPPFDTATMLPFGADVGVTLTAVHRSMGNYQFNGPRRFQGNDLIPAGGGGSNVDFVPVNGVSNIGPIFA